jgi:hypothetical protein
VNGSESVSGAQPDGALADRGVVDGETVASAGDPTAEVPHVEHVPIKKRGTRKR